MLGQPDCLPYKTLSVSMMENCSERQQLKISTTKAATGIV